MKNTELERKGKAGEEALDSWLKREGFSYLAVCQEPDRFAPLFTGNLKRPDFLVLLESIGMVAVDAKNCALTKGEYTLPYEAEFQRAMTFERVFRLPVWYAYKSEEDGVWHWISAMKAIEVGQARKHGTTEETFLALKLRNFERIVSNADFGKLYTHRLPGLSKLKAVAAR